MTRRAPDNGARACNQLLHAERLGQIVIRSGIDSLHPLRPGAAGRQHQHGHGAARAPPPLEHRQTINFWEPKVENHEIVVLGVATKPSLFAVAGNVDEISGRFERGAHIGCNARLILDHENAHQSASSLSISAVSASTSISRSWPAGVITLNSYT